MFEGLINFVLLSLFFLGAVATCPYGATMIIGERVECAVCRRMKKPIGRSAPMEMAGPLCDYDCKGYRLDPQPSQLWPGESTTEEERQ